MKKVIFFLIFCTSLSLSAQEAKWLTDLDQAKQLAKETNKPILMYFTGSDWCGPCKMLKKDFWLNPDFLSQAQDFILVEVDIPFKEDVISKEQMEKNKKLQAKYNKEKSFPTLLALDSSGRVKDKISAYSMLRDTSGYFSFLERVRNLR